jgi:hypothetical protein
MSDWFYALRVSRGKRASKGYLWEGDRLVRDYDYDAGWQFDAVRSTEFDNLAGLADALRKLESRDNYFVIRGELRGGATRREKVNRLSSWNDKDRQPDWEQRDRQWAMFDIDDILWSGPEVVSQLEYERRLVGIIKEKLPACFHNVGFFYQLSSSAGLTQIERGTYRVGHTTLKVHLWYWIDRPLCCPSIREWIRGSNLPIDAAPFNPVQPHYTSNPTFRGGDDPLQFRSGIINGICNVLTLPDCVTGRDDYVRAKKPVQPSLTSYVRQANMGKGFVESAAGAILGTPPGHGRHFALNKSGYTLGGAVASGAVSFQDSFDAIMSAAICVGIKQSEAERIGRRAIEDGMMEPIELSESRHQFKSAPPIAMGSAVKRLLQPEPEQELEPQPALRHNPMQDYVNRLMQLKDRALDGYYGRGKRNNPVELHWFAVCQHIDNGQSLLLSHLPAYAALLFGNEAARYENTQPRNDAQRLACELIMQMGV